MNSFRAIEEIAKLEQRNALRRCKFITLFNTHVVKSLSEEDKKKFFNYLKYRKIKKNLFTATIFLSLFGAIFLRPELTGNVIFSEDATASTASNILIIVSLLTISILGLIKLSNRERTKRFSSHIAVLER